MTRPPELLPPADPANIKLVTCRVGPETTWLRFVRARDAGPLGHGPRSVTRFADPAIDEGRPQRFFPIYFGASYGCCFVETILRDRANGSVGDWPVSEAELALWTCVQVEVHSPLRVVDLRGDHVVRMRVPTDAVRAMDQRPGRLWSKAFHDHPEHVHGVIYRSRLCDDDCL